MFFRRSEPDLRPSLEIETRLRIEAEAERDRLRIQLEARDDDVRRLQREVENLKFGALGRLVAITQRRDAARLEGRRSDGKFVGVSA